MLTVVCVLTVFTPIKVLGNACDDDDLAKIAAPRNQQLKENSGYGDLSRQQLVELKASSTFKAAEATNILLGFGLFLTGGFVPTILRADGISNFMEAHMSNFAMTTGIMMIGSSVLRTVEFPIKARSWWDRFLLTTTLLSVNHTTEIAGRINPDWFDFSSGLLGIATFTLVDVVHTRRLFNIPRRLDD